MPVASFPHPIHGRLYLGRQQPRIVAPRLELRNYRSLAEPKPPAEVNYTGPHAGAALAEIYLNNQLGDCVIAALAHAFGVFAGHSGGPQAIFTDQQIQDLYSWITGYVPGDPSTDNGTSIQAALHFVASKGFLGHRIAGYLGVNATDATEVQLAIWLFENLIIGLNLPDAYVNPLPSGWEFLWGLAGRPNPANGHCVLGAGYSDNPAARISTWGMCGWMTFAAIAKYCVQSAGGDLYVILTPEMLIKGTKRAPNGLKWAQLAADFAALSSAPV
jgi:hypothetical protein